MTGALVAVGIAALVGITRGHRRHPARAASGPAWSALEADDAAACRAPREIASHVAAAYRDQGKQLVKVDANDISYKGIPLLVALRKSRRGRRRHPGPRREGRPLPDVRPGAELPDRPRQALARSACSCCAARRSSWRSTRFRYLRTSSRSSCSSRRRPGKAQTIALYFSRDDAAPRARPAADLVAAAARRRRPRRSRSRPTRTLVDQTTNPYLFSLMGSSFNDRGFLVLDPYSAGGRPQAAEAPEGPAEAGRGRGGERRDAAPQASGG